MTLIASILNRRQLVTVVTFFLLVMQLEISVTQTGGIMEEVLAEAVLKQQEQIVSSLQAQLIAAIGSGAWNACQVWGDLLSDAIASLDTLGRRTDIVLRERIQALLDRLAALQTENTQLKEANDLLRGDDDSDKATIEALTAEVLDLRKQLEEALALLPD